MKKLVSLVKNYLFKSSPATPAPTFKTEQYEKAKKNLLDQTSNAGCECAHEKPKTAPKAKPANVAPASEKAPAKKPVAKNTPKPKPKGK